MGACSAVALWMGCTSDSTGALFCPHNQMSATCLTSQRMPRVVAHRRFVCSGLSLDFVPIVLLVLLGIFNGFSPHATRFGCHFRGLPVNRTYMASCSSPPAANHVCLRHGGEVYAIRVHLGFAAVLVVYSTVWSPFFICGLDHGRCLLWQVLP